MKQSLMVLNRKRDWKVICIYKITNPKGHFYIGQTLNLYRRQKTHKNAKCTDQPLLYNSYVNYGIENHIIEILKKCPKEFLNKWEIYYIKKYKNISKSLNLQFGGINGKHAESSKQKIKASNQKPKGKSWLINVLAARKRDKIKIHQFTIKNKFIKEWDCALDAAKSCGLTTPSMICKYADTNKVIRGFIWKRFLI